MAEEGDSVRQRQTEPGKGVGQAEPRPFILGKREKNPPFVKAGVARRQGAMQLEGALKVERANAEVAAAHWQSERKCGQNCRQSALPAGEQQTKVPESTGEWVLIKGRRFGEATPKKRKKPRKSRKAENSRGREIIQRTQEISGRPTGPNCWSPDDFYTRQAVGEHGKRGRSGRVENFAKNEYCLREFPNPALVKSRAASPRRRSRQQLTERPTDSGGTLSKKQTKDGRGSGQRKEKQPKGRKQEGIELRTLTQTAEETPAVAEPPLKSIKSYEGAGQITPHGVAPTKGTSSTTRPTPLSTQAEEAFWRMRRCQQTRNSQGSPFEDGHDGR